MGGRVRVAGHRHLLLLAMIVLGLSLQPQAAHAAPQWYSPVDVSEPSVVAFGGEVVVDGDDQATAVWLRSAGFGSRVQAAIRPTGRLSFGTVQTVSPGSEDTSDPHVAVNDSGEAVVVWTRTSDGVIRAAHRAAGSSLFGAAVTISGGGAFGARVAIDLAGNASAIWVRAVGASTVIETATRPAGGPFGAVETVSNLAPSYDGLDVEAEGDSRASAVWTRFDGSASVVQTSARRELNYPRPGGATPLVVPLVPEFRECTPPTNSTHVAPLSEPSCSPPTLASSLLTTSAVGSGTGSARYDVVAGDPSTPADEADFGITARTTDVRCTAGGTPGCAAAGSDYTGQAIMTSTVRQTDLSNGGFEDDPGTLTNFDLSVPMSCAVNPLMNVGATCSMSSTADALIPGYVIERTRTILGIVSARVMDAGVDGSVTPVSGSCPPTCGSGDEAVFLRQGVFFP